MIFHVIHSREDNKCCSRGNKFNGLYDGKYMKKKLFKSYDCSEMQFRCKNPSGIQKNSRIQSRQKRRKTAILHSSQKIPEQTQWNTFQPKNAGILPIFFRRIQIIPLFLKFITWFLYFFSSLKKTYLRQNQIPFFLWKCLNHSQCLWLKK